jgi:hypothetical protein
MLIENGCPPFTFDWKGNELVLDLFMLKRLTYPKE